jgi:hypothetical protein
MPKNTTAAHLRMTLDGETFELVTKPADLVAAEHSMRREKIPNPTENAPILMQTKLAFAAFGRVHPEHPVARDWPKFLTALDDLAEDSDEDEQEPDPLDPTQPADTSSWP